MSLASFFTGWKSLAHRRSLSRARQNCETRVSHLRRVPRVETLEDRWVMAAAWPVYGHDSALTGMAAELSGPADATLAWSANGTGGPQLVGDDEIYAGNKAVNFDGSIKWELSIDGSTAIAPTGILADGSIYYWNSDLGKVYLVNPDSGSVDQAGQLSASAVQWTLTVPTGIGGGVVNSANGTLYLRVGQGYSNIYAISPTGNLNWTFPIPEGAVESPAVGPDGTVFIGSESDYLFALRPTDGSVKWKFRASGDVNSSPTVDAQGNVYLSSTDFTFYKLNSSGKIVWKNAVKEPRGGMSGWGWNDGGVAIDQVRRTAVYTGYNGLYAYNMDTGVLKWKFTDGITRSPWTHPAIDGSGRIYFIETRLNKVFALNSNGAKLWEGGIDDAQWPTSPVLGPNGVLYAGASSIFAFQDGGLGRPTITKLSASADPVEAGAAFTLTAADVTDWPNPFNSGISQVDFYRDVDGDLHISEAVDEYLGAGIPSTEYYYQYLFDTTAPATAGLVTYLARAIDNDGNYSNVVHRTVEVVDQALLALFSDDSASGTSPRKKK